MSFARTIALAEQASPETVEKTAEAVALLGRIAPEFVPEVLGQFQKVAQIAHTPLTKTAGAMDTAKAVGAGVGVALAASLGTAIATDLYDVARRGLTKGVNFRRIMEANPELKRETDPKRLRAAFDALHRYAPDFTADPTVGGSLLKNLANMPPGAEANVITNLISARKNLVETKQKQFAPKFEVKGPQKKEDHMHYHQHFEGKGPDRKPLGLKHPEKK